MKKQRVAIVIPTYNENENIVVLIKAIRAVVADSTVIVVDDQSPDGTGKSVSKLAAKDQRVKLITNKKKNGRGAAVLHGFQQIVKENVADVIIEMDADFSHRPEELPLLIEKVGQNQVALASRYIKGGRTENWSITRRIFSRCANWLIRFVLRLPLKDNTNGYRAYSKQALQTLLKHHFLCSSYLVLSESALILHRHHFIFCELPSVFPNRKLGSSNTNWQEVVKNLAELKAISQMYASGCSCGN